MIRSESVKMAGSAGRIDCHWHWIPPPRTMVSTAILLQPEMTMIKHSSAVSLALLASFAAATQPPGESESRALFVEKGNAHAVFQIGARWKTERDASTLR